MTSGFGVIPATVDLSSVTESGIGAEMAATTAAGAAALTGVTPIAPDADSAEFAQALNATGATYWRQWRITSSSEPPLPVRSRWLRAPTLPWTRSTAPP